MLFRPPALVRVPIWIRMGPDGRTLYTFSPDTAGDPAYWAMDLPLRGAPQARDLRSFRGRTVRGVFDTDGHRFYFVAG